MATPAAAEHRSRKCAGTKPGSELAVNEELPLALAIKAEGARSFRIAYGVSTVDESPNRRMSMETTSMGDSSSKCGPPKSAPPPWRDARGCSCLGGRWLGAGRSRCGCGTPGFLHGFLSFDFFSGRRGYMGHGTHEPMGDYYNIYWPPEEESARKKTPSTTKTWGAEQKNPQIEGSRVNPPVATLWWIGVALYVTL